MNEPEQMTDKEEKEISSKLSRHIAQFINRMLPKYGRDASVMLSGAIANVIVRIPDDLWKEFMQRSVERCDKPNCDCHIVGRKFWEGMNALREDRRAWSTIDKQRN